MVGPVLSRVKAEDTAILSLEPKGSPVSASLVLGLQPHATMPGICMWFWGFNGDPYAFDTSTSLTGLPFCCYLYCQRGHEFSDEHRSVGVTGKRGK